MVAHATGDVQIKQFERGLLGGGEGGLIASFLRGGSAMTILSLLLLWLCQKASESLTSSVQSLAMGDTDSFGGTTETAEMFKVLSWLDHDTGRVL